MKIVGCDLHTRYQQIAMLDEETGELIERRLEHASGEARAFYAALAVPVRVGIEATGHTRWFERMLAELGHELWIGDGRVAQPFNLFFLPVPELWVPRPCAFCKGGHDAADTMGFHAQRPASNLRCASPALYHLFVLPAIAFAEFGTSPRTLPCPPRTDASAIPFRHCRVRCHARAYSPSAHRTRGGQSIDGDASFETACRARTVAQTKTRRSSPSELFGEAPRRAFWQARCYDFNVWSAKKRVEKLRYMYRNPVKRSLVESPEQWRWSSCPHYLLDEAGSVQVNVGWGKISFPERVA